MNARTILTLTTLLVLVLVLIDTPALAQKNANLSFNGDVATREALSNTALRQHIKSKLKLRYDGRATKGRVYMAQVKNGRIMKNFTSEPFDLRPGTNALPDGVLPNTDWMPTGAAARSGFSFGFLDWLFGWEEEEVEEWQPDEPPTPPKKDNDWFINNGLQANNDNGADETLYVLVGPAGIGDFKDGGFESQGVGINLGSQ